MTPSKSAVKRALVTGASEGIGRVFALRLAERGYEVIIVARNAERLDSLLKELPGTGHKKIACDLSSPAGIAEVVREMKAGEKINLLINNAGYGLLGDFAQTELTKHQAMIALNISALVELSHAFLSRAVRGDGIVQVSSTLSLMPMPVQPVYSATKAFVTSFSESLWFQTRGKGITILNLCPGSTKTEFAVRSGGDSKNVPAFITESADLVVSRALRAYDQNAGPTFISGWKNRFMVFIFRFLSRKTMVEIMGAIRQ